MELSEHLFRREALFMVSAVTRIFPISSLALVEDVTGARCDLEGEVSLVPTYFKRDNKVTVIFNPKAKANSADIARCPSNLGMSAKPEICQLKR